MTGVLIRGRGYTDRRVETQGEDHVKKETKIRVTLLQTKEYPEPLRN